MNTSKENEEIIILTFFCFILCACAHTCVTCHVCVERIARAYMCVYDTTHN